MHTLSRDVIRYLFDKAKKERDPDEKKRLYQWAMASEDNSRLNAIVSQARYEPGIAVAPENLDSDPYLLNCLNGTINLKTFQISPHVHSDLITKICKTNYDPDAKCPLWLAFLDRVMSGNNNLISFLQRASGYSAIGIVSEHVLIFLYGGGRNGKSTFLETVSYVMGDYGITINADILMENKYKDHPTGIADLHGRRFVCTEEVGEGKKLAEDLVNRITGGSKISARRLYENSFDFTPSHTLWFAANNQPHIASITEGIWSRIKQVPFSIEIPKHERDRTLPFKLQAEAPGILNWILEGCRDWQRDGLNEPNEVSAATEAYRADSDLLGPFFEQQCIIAPGREVVSSDLYRVYCSWAVKNGYQSPLTSNMFGRHCENEAIERRRGTRCSIARASNSNDHMRVGSTGIIP